jgi:hypothetical protein
MSLFWIENYSLEVSLTSNKNANRHAIQSSLAQNLT